MSSTLSKIAGFTNMLVASFPTVSFPIMDHQIIFFHNSSKLKDLVIYITQKGSFCFDFQKLKKSLKDLGIQTKQRRCAG